MASNVRPESLQEQQQMFRRIYEEHNDDLYSIHDIQSQIWEKISQIIECVRKERTEEVVICLPVLYGWMMALWNRIGIDISEAAWFKYPNICPYCFKKERCLCITEDLVYNQESVNLNIFRRDVRRKASSIAEWQAMYNRIYGNINKIKAMTAVWFHFVEEVGEMSRELRHKDAQGVMSESADAFAQFLAFCTKLNIDIDDLVWRTYPGECNVCRKEKCVCEYD